MSSHCSVTREVVGRGCCYCPDGKGEDQPSMWRIVNWSWSDESEFVELKTVDTERWNHSTKRDDRSSFSFNDRSRDVPVHCWMDPFFHWIIPSVSLLDPSLHLPAAIDWGDHFSCKHVERDGRPDLLSMQRHNHRECKPVGSMAGKRVCSLFDDEWNRIDAHRWRSVTWRWLMNRPTRWTMFVWSSRARWWSELFCVFSVGVAGCESSLPREMWVENCHCYSDCHW